ncbi:MAG: transcriptional repressor [Chloroflexi bacterium]|nr:transcriptional repressor [Chloroflexota bacterium]
MSNALQRLRDAGYKLTGARTTVLRVLEDSGGHVTSAELLERVSTADANIGRASVFRALDLFTRLAIVRPTYGEGSAAPIYVLLPGGHHHHIVCTVCHRVIEFDDCRLGELNRELEARYQMQMTGHLLEFYGVCAACARNVAQEA